MSAILNDERTDAKRTQVHDRPDAIGRSHDPAPDRRHVTQMVTAEEEMAFVAKSVFALAIVGITPLVLFLVIHYFQLWFSWPV